MSMSDSIVLDIRDLKSHFFTAKGEIPAVDGVSIEVPAGKIIGIVGEERLRQKHDRHVCDGTAPSSWQDCRRQHHAGRA